jgi:hypothetical protein
VLLQAQLLATAATPEAAVAQLSFYPGDASKLCTVSAAGAAHVWTLERLLSGFSLTRGTAAQQGVTAHAWAPEGLYVSRSDASVACLDPLTLEPLAESSAVDAETGAAPLTTSCMAASADGLLLGSSRLQWRARLAPEGASSPGKAGRRSDGGAAAADKPAGPASSEDAASASPSAPAPGRAGARFHVPAMPLEEVHGVNLGAPVSSMDVGGGSRGRDAVVVTSDGSVLVLRHAADGSSLAQGAAAMQLEPIAMCHAGAITGLAAHPDGEHFLSCGLDGSLRVWQAASGQLAGRLDVGGRLTCMAAAGPGSPLLAVGSEAGTVR